MSEGFIEDENGQSNAKDVIIDLNKNREIVHSSKTRSASKRMRLFPVNYTTSDNYEDSAIFDMRLFTRALIHIKNTHSANAIKYNLLVCNDPTQWYASKSDQALAAGAEAAEAITDAWAWVKIQVKSSVGGNAGKVYAVIAGKVP